MVDNLIVEELYDGVDGLNKYLMFEDSEEWNIRRVKKFIKSDTFAQRDYPLIRKLYVMFDPKQRVSSDVLRKQTDLYVDLLNEGFDVDKKFPEFSGFVNELFSTRIETISNDQLYAMLHSVAKLKDGVQSEAIRNFKLQIPNLYLQDIDSMNNRRLSILIGHIKDKEFDDLDEKMKNFVVELYKRCAVKTETADNNKLKLSTYDWFKENASNYFGQFNKAFFDVGLYENSFLDEPTKKIRFEYLCKYADFQNEFINKMEKLAKDRGMSVARLLSRQNADFVYDVACECRKTLNIPNFPEYDPNNRNFNRYYLREPREYKTSVTPKMANLFRSMIESKIKYGLCCGDTRLMAETLSDFVVTRKKDNQVVRIICDHMSEESFEDGYVKLGEWLVESTHLDEFLRVSAKDLIPTFEGGFEKTEVEEDEEKLSDEELIEYYERLDEKMRDEREEEKERQRMIEQEQRKDSIEKPVQISFLEEEKEK